jgi:hypothetical protein
MDKSLENNIIDEIDKTHIDEGDIILIRLNPKINVGKLILYNISNYIHKKGGFAIFAAKDITIEKFDEKQMEKMGWVRKEKVRSYI